MVRPEGAIEDHPAVAVHGSLIYALVGKASDAERWATAAERCTVTGMLDDGNTMERHSWRTCARCCVAAASMKCSATRDLHLTV